MSDKSKKLLTAYFARLRLVAFATVATVLLVALADFSWPPTAREGRLLALGLASALVASPVTALVLLAIPMLFWKFASADDRARAEAHVRMFEAASPAERPELDRLYGLWLKQGMAAQGNHTLLGGLIVFLSVPLFAVAARTDLPVVFYAAGVLVLVAGVAQVIRAGRRETSWRRAHPFEVWRLGPHD